MEHWQKYTMLRASSGAAVDRVRAPCSQGGRPVNSDAWEGQVHEPGAVTSEKDTPASAMAATWGATPAKSSASVDSWQAAQCIGKL